MWWWLLDVDPIANTAVLFDWHNDTMTNDRLQKALVNHWRAEAGKGNAEISQSTTVLENICDHDVGVGNENCGLLAAAYGR